MIHSFPSWSAKAGAYIRERRLWVPPCFSIISKLVLFTRYTAVVLWDSAYRICSILYMYIYRICSILYIYIYYNINVVNLMHIYIYIYIYICVCVCVCVCLYSCCLTIVQNEVKVSFSIVSTPRFRGGCKSFR